MLYELRRSKRTKAMRVEVHPGGVVRLIAPHAASESSIERFFGRYAAWIRDAQKRMQEYEVIEIRPSDIPRLKQDAMHFAKRAVAHYARLYGAECGKISIRAQKTRWGSCSKAGNLSFNYKIAALPEKLRNYIIVHEVCHVLQFDHSKAFWDLVAREVPDHSACRAEIRRMRFRFA